MVTKEEAKKRGPGRPKKTTKTWHCMLRLPVAMAAKLKKAAEDNAMSINNTIETVLGSWLDD